MAEHQTANHFVGVVNQCHNSKQCHYKDANKVGEQITHHLCSQCLRALYCSLECQQRHWDKTHQETCRSLSWDLLLPMKSDYEVTRKKSGAGEDKKSQPSTSPLATTTRERQGSVFETLRNKFVELVGDGGDAGTSLRDNLFVSDFFAAVRINLQATLDTLRLLYADNASALNRMLDFWSETRPGGSLTGQRGPGRPAKQRVTKTRLEQWKADTSDENYGTPTKTDREISILLERGKIYRDLAINCRSLLGVERSTITAHEPLTPQQGRYLNKVFYDEGISMSLVQPGAGDEQPEQDNDSDDESEESTGGGKQQPINDDATNMLPPLSWATGLDQSIYLNLDWDDVKKERLAWNLVETGFVSRKDRRYKLPDITNSLVFESISKARMRWLTSVRDVLLDLDSMVGLADVKEMIGHFLLQQITYPSAPTVSGNYLNFLVGGNPGTGKTTIAQKFPPLLYLLGLTAAKPDPLPRLTTRNDWIAEYEGQTAMKTRQGLMHGLGKLVIIDEFYALRVGGDRDVYGNEFINQLVNDMSLYRGLLSVMGMGYYQRIEENILKANEGLDRRFNVKWRIANYGGGDLFQILLNKLVDQQYSLPGISRQLAPKEQKKTIKDLTKVLLSSSSKIPASVKVTTDQWDQYDSVYHILVALQGTGLFDEINAAVIPPLISDYNNTVTANLLVDSKGGGGAISIELFDERYEEMRSGDVKKFDLDVFIKTLTRYALQKGYVVSKK